MKKSNKELVEEAILLGKKLKDDALVFMGESLNQAMQFENEDMSSLFYPMRKLNIEVLRNIVTDLIFCGGSGGPYRYNS